MWVGGVDPGGQHPCDSRHSTLIFVARAKRIRNKEGVVRVWG